jgi:sulfatase modifying factor 1
VVGEAQAVGNRSVAGTLGNQGLILVGRAGSAGFTCCVPMKTRTLIPFVAVLFAAFVFAAQSRAQSPLVTIDTVTVGDAGNAADTTGYGAVPYNYAIGKYEVTIGQYAAFLNSVAATSTSTFIVDLFNTNMAENLSIGPSISRSGSVGNFVYSVVGTSSNLPITAVSWFDAARFANWMHNGATNGASTETGAYALHGATNGIIIRQPNAAWWIPSEDEWYKAAYFKGGNTTAGYWRYPTASDSPPTPEPDPPGGTNSGNFGLVRPLGDRRVEVGSFTLSASPAGSFDQGGNVAEWNDAVFDGKRGIRGGDYISPEYVLDSSRPRYGILPEEEYANFGFRVASVPEPSTYALLLITGAGALWWARRRR